MERDELAHLILFLVSRPSGGKLNHKLFVQTEGTELVLGMIVGQMDHKLASSVKIFASKVTEEFHAALNLDLAELIRILILAV